MAKKMKRHVETSIRNQISLTMPISSYAGPKKKLNFLSNFTKIRTNFKRENKKYSYFFCRNPGLLTNHSSQFVHDVCVIKSILQKKPVSVVEKGSENKNKIYNI